MRRLAVGGCLLSAVFCLLAYLAAAPSPSGQTTRLAGFVTRLAGRTSAQRHNAVRAAALLDGAVAPPHGTFSFNRRVRGWEPERGFVRAPVSYDGALIPAFGGGVCQMSSTLYNAALLAGLGVAERHPHAFAPRYVAPGRDAAVALPYVDLRLVNPYPFPVRIRARADGDRLIAEIWGGPTAGNPRHEILTHVLNQSAPTHSTMASLSSAREGRPNAVHNSVVATQLRPKPMTGYRVVTYRLTARPGHSPARERLSDDSYASSQ